MPTLKKTNSQEGGILVIIIILVVIVGLLVGGYFISQNTNFFPKASSPQITIPLPSPSLIPKATIKPATQSAVYENPFNAQTQTENPFEENYQNPFNNL